MPVVVVAVAVVCVALISGDGSQPRQEVKVLLSG